ncbi:MAG: hypothetical protein KIS76_10420 [Pyrinomonadaceae bacterium]|nr:hypothetical protein [Pyrinomonadaceae bacterium]
MLTDIDTTGKVYNAAKSNSAIETENRSFSLLSDRSVAFRLFLTCWLIFGLHFATNTVREIYPAISLAEHFSFDVFEYAGLHPDIFTMDGRGTFINNNPGASIMGAVPYLLLRPLTDTVTSRVQAARANAPRPENAEYDTIYPMAQEFYRKAREKGLDVKFGLAAGITQSLMMAPVSALGVVVMFFVLLRLTDSRNTALFLALLYAFATPVLYRTAQLNQNILAAHFAFFAFVLLWRPSCWQSKIDENRPFYLLAGLCAGWTVVLDYSGVVSVAVLSVYALFRWIGQRSRNYSDLLKYGSGVAVSLAVLLAYQWSSFGNPFFPAQTYMPPANFTEIGYRGFGLPNLSLLAQTAFSIRYGLFAASPILLFALAAPVWIRRSTSFLPRHAMTAIVGFTAAFFLFCSANQYGWMQFNTGVRHIVPVVPFVFLLAANVLWKMPRTVSWLIGGAAVFWSWSQAMFRDVEQGSGIFESVRHVLFEGFSLPWLTTLERMGYFESAPVLPVLAVSAVVVWAIWTFKRSAVRERVI